jgi:hypothetical protein
MSAHAVRTTSPATPDPSASPQPPAEQPTPTSVKLLRNADVPVLALALILFLVTGLPIAGWVAGAGAWAIQRALDELAKRRAKSAEDVRTRVGLLAGSMILRGWIVAGIIVAVGIGDEDAGLAAAILFIAVFTLQFTMTMAMRPFEVAAEKATREPGAGP